MSIGSAHSNCSSDTNSYGNTDRDCYSYPYTDANRDSYSHRYAYTHAGPDHTQRAWLQSGWNLIGVADFNGDGYEDYAVVYSSTGQTAIGYLSG